MFFLGAELIVQDKYNSIFEQMSASRSSLSKRRQKLIQSIHNAQRSQIKQRKRQCLRNSLCPKGQVHRLHSILPGYNIQYFPQEILQMVNWIGQEIQSQTFCVELRVTGLIEDLIRTVLGQQQRKPYLEAKALVQAVVCLVSNLAIRGGYFAKIVSDSWILFLGALEKYPLSVRILERIACLFRHLPLNLNLNYTGFLTSLTDIYLLRESYEIQNGEFLELEIRGSSGWFKNALWTLEIIDCLLLSNAQRQETLKLANMKKSLQIGLEIYLQYLKHRPLLQIEQQCNQSQTLTEFSSLSQVTEHIQTCFACLVLDILLIRQCLVSENQGGLLTSIHWLQLPRVAQSPRNTDLTRKVIRILYEQVLLTDDDLSKISQDYPVLQPYCESLIRNDYI